MKNGIGTIDHEMLKFGARHIAVAFVPTKSVTASFRSCLREVKMR